MFGFLSYVTVRAAAACRRRSKAFFSLLGVSGSCNFSAINVEKID
jgi:hypothetical protein